MAVDIKKRNDRQNKWIKENADRINFMMPKGTKARIQEVAAKDNKKVSQWLNEAILEKLNKSEVKAET